MDQYRIALGKMLAEVSADMAKALVDMPPNVSNSGGKESDSRSRAWSNYIKLKELHENLLRAMTHLV